MEGEPRDLKVYTTGETYLATYDPLTAEDGRGWLFRPEIGRIGSSRAFGSIANHMPYADWKPVPAAEIPPRLLELLARSGDKAGALQSRGVTPG